ncbi:MAG: phosphopantetheine-binding protein [Gammaproteobacteria bacterium]|nr:phosphopantetheine-binding protein [Gammaproteobacteria bacterium]
MIKDKLRSYILENFLFTDDQSELNNEDSFMDQGIIDSTAILELLFFLEEEFSIKVEAEEMIPDNLDSINKVTRFIESKSSHLAN